MEPTRAVFNWRCASGSETNQQTYRSRMIRSGLFTLTQAKRSDEKQFGNCVSEVFGIFSAAIRAWRLYGLASRRAGQHRQLDGAEGGFSSDSVGAYEE